MKSPTHLAPRVDLHIYSNCSMDQEWRLGGLRCILDLRYQHTFTLS